jgi:AraC-like DNA-binding protein
MRAEREHIATPPDASWQYHTWRASKFNVPWHFHPEFELTLITTGSGLRIVGDSIENYRPGDLALIGAELAHTYMSPTPERSEYHGDDAEQEAIVIQFRRDFLGTDLLSRPEFVVVAQLLDRAARGLSFDAGPTLEESLRSLAAEPPAERTLGLLQLLVELARDSSARALSSTPSGQRLSGPVRKRMEAACTHLQSAYTEPVRLADVAEVAHMTPAAFSRAFRRTFGRTMTDYVTELRIAAACQLLADSDLPITDVAARSGYDNLSNFNRRFRALKGASPREYRRTVTMPR